MKKILLVLIMMVSSSFAVGAPKTYWVVDGQTYKLNQISFNPIIVYAGMASQPPQSSRVTYCSRTAVNNVSYLQCEYYELTGATGKEYYYEADQWQYYHSTFTCSLDTNTCPSPSTIVDGECFLPEKCDNVHGQFLSASTGQCVDCMPFPTFEGRATCACDAGGSTYSPNAVSPIYSEVVGNYSYSKQGATCANGKAVTIYYDPVPTSPTDNNNTTPTDNNTSTNPTDTNNSTPTDGNTTTTTPTQAAVVQALKDIQNGQKDATTALKDTGVDVKAIKEQMAKNGTTFNDMLAQMQQGNAKADKMYQLMDDEFKGQTQIGNAMGKWIDQDLLNATAQLGATVGVKDAVNGTTGAVNNATNAINTQGEKLGGKLDDILQAIKDNNGSGTKDGNGTDLSKVEDKLDTLHKDNNKTHSTLDKIAGFFDSNTSVDTNGSGSSMSIDDMLPSGGSGWFSSNALDLNFGGISVSGSGCQCATAEFKVAGNTFVFPPPELLAMIPFSAISKLIMALIYLLGLKTFLRI